MAGTSAASRARKRRVRRRLLAIAVLMFLSPLVTITMGPAAVPLREVVGVVLSHIPGVPITITWDGATDAIVWSTRLPRIITGLAVGAVLGVSGVALQAIVRNPLAEPYVLGVSAGAGTGAAAALIIFGVSSVLGVGTLAFGGALAATAGVLAITGLGGRSLELILAGLAVGFGCQSVTNLIIFSSGSPETNQAVLFWLLGSLSRATWSTVLPAVLTAVALTVFLIVTGPILDALATGDHSARSLGLDPGRTRLLILLPTSAAVGLIVAVSGGIGFVGLVIPHIMRRVVGYSHRALVLGSACAAALYLVWMDSVARIMFAPQELPIGVMTGLIGSPFLVLLVRRQRRTAR